MVEITPPIDLHAGERCGICKYFWLFCLELQGLFRTLNKVESIGVGMLRILRLVSLRL